MRVRRHHAWGAILIVLFALPILRPDGIDALERPVGSFFGWFGRLPALNPKLWDGGAFAPEQAENPWVQALQVENAQLRERMAEREQVHGDWAAFVRALQENAGTERPPRATFARVLRATDAGGRRQSILIDRGEVDGVETGAAVAAGAVYLGRVGKVFRRSALVQLLTDRQSRIEVALRSRKNVRVTGFVHGRGFKADEADLDIAHLRLDDEAGELQVGAPVVTSNADAQVPAGLLVGTVTEVRDENLDGMPTVRFRPALDLARSTQVLVLGVAPRAR